MSKQLLLDSTQLTYKLDESLTAVGKDRLRIAGRGKFYEERNRNNRIYPKRVWESQLREGSDFQRAVKERRVFGHLEHPKDGRSDLNQAAIVITEAKVMPEGYVGVVFETLSTECGKTAAALLKDGLTIGFSSRAEGSVVARADGINEVQDDFRLETFDLVAEPSTPGAFLHESLQNNLKNRKPEELKLEESSAKCEIQIEALKKDLFSARKFSKVFEHRLNDIKYLSKQIRENKAIEMAIGILEEAIKSKRMTEEEEKLPADAQIAPAEPAATVQNQPQGSITYKKLEFSADINSLSDDTKKKINVFRQGEDLATLQILIRAELSGAHIAMKDVETTWDGNDIKVCVEFDGDDIAVHDKLTTIFGTGSPSTPTEEPAMDDEITSPEEQVAVQESIIRKLLKEKEENEKKIRHLVTENKNLRILHNETIKLFEKEFVKIEAKAMIREYPQLKKCEKVLLASRNRDTLHESANLFLSASGERRQPEFRKEVSARAIESTATVSSSQKLSEAALPPIDEMIQHGSVSDGKRQETIMSRLADKRRVS